MGFTSDDASLSAALLAARSVDANSTHGMLRFAEALLLPNLARNTTGYAPPDQPTLTLHSTYGDVTLDGVIAMADEAKSSLQCNISSHAGNVKALFSGGAINGSYDVLTPPTAIGSVGIVTTSVRRRALGTLGTGRARLRHQRLWPLALALDDGAGHLRRSTATRASRPLWRRRVRAASRLPATSCIYVPVPNSSEVTCAVSILQRSLRHVQSPAKSHSARKGLRAQPQLARGTSKKLRCGCPARRTA